MVNLHQATAKKTPSSETLLEDLGKEPQGRDFSQNIRPRGRSCFLFLEGDCSFMFRRPCMWRPLGCFYSGFFVLRISPGFEGVSLAVVSLNQLRSMDLGGLGSGSGKLLGSKIFS